MGDSATQFLCQAIRATGFQSKYNLIIWEADYNQIAPNVSIISGNHDLYDTRIKINKEVYIGNYCWLGAGVIVLPGVVLGDFTIVAAGSIVTKSFPGGYCVIGGNTAKELRKLEKEKCIRYEVANRFYGYLSEKQFLKSTKSNQELFNSIVSRNYF